MTLPQLIHTIVIMPTLSRVASLPAEVGRTLGREDQMDQLPAKRPIQGAALGHLHAIGSLEPQPRTNFDSQSFSGLRSLAQL